MEDFLIERPVVFGEALFDIFSPDRRVLGGAPFNVAWHLKGFGLDPLLISAVGQDKLGDEIVTKMKDWGMDISGVQRLDQYPTGQVVVKNASIDPSFEIRKQQAYDFIDFNEAQEALQESGDMFSLIYHGTLATREEASRRTLNRLVKRLDRPVFLDVNIREPFWDRRWTEFFAGDASWVKLNEDELVKLMKSKDYDRQKDLKKLGFELMDQRELEFLAVTLGDDGAWFWVGEELIVPDNLDVWRSEGDRFITSVGAGDAFSAVIILGIIMNWENQQILARALEFAWKICLIEGAVSEDKNFYGDMLRTWL